MNDRFRQSSSPWPATAGASSKAGPTRRQGGTTLVEALVGMALLGGLLVALLVGQAQLVAQRARAEEHLEACRLADQLIESWWSDQETFPRRSQGTVSGLYRWRWRTQVGPSKEAEEARAELVALELVRQGTETAKDPRAALRVELLLPKGGGP